MRRGRIGSAILAIAIALMAVTAVSASMIVIKLKDGTTVYYDMSEVEYIQYYPASSLPMVSPITPPASSTSIIAGVKLPFNAGSIVLAEEFADGLGTRWSGLSAVGGDFARFAKFKDGDLIVDVPAGNSWGNTGIVNKAPLFTLSAAEKDKPVTIFIKLNAAATTSFVAALAPYAQMDIWSYQNAWFTYTPSLIREETLNNAYGLLNTQSQERYGTDGALPIKDTGAPAWVAFRVYVGKIELYLPGQDKPFELKLGWLKEGSPIYLHLFTALRKIGDPAKLSADAVFVAK